MSVDCKSPTFLDVMYSIPLATWKAKLRRSSASSDSSSVSSTDETHGSELLRCTWETDWETPNLAETAALCQTDASARIRRPSPPCARAVATGQTVCERTQQPSASRTGTHTTHVPGGLHRVRDVVVVIASFGTQEGLSFPPHEVQ